MATKTISLGGTLLQLLKKRMVSDDFLPDEDVLDRLDMAQETPLSARQEQLWHQ